MFLDFLIVFHMSGRIKRIDSLDWLGFGSVVIHAKNFGQQFFVFVFELSLWIC